jgi:hypothetical protein
MNKRLLSLLFLYIGVLLISNGNSKILLMVGSWYYQASPSKISQFKQDVAMFDNKNVVETDLDICFCNGSNVDYCSYIRNIIEQEYGNDISTGDPLEGVVLLGDIPVPTYTDGLTPYESYDYYYMDIWNSTTNQAYPNSPYSGMGPFSVNSIDPGYFSDGYNTLVGDSKFEIWVSRIYGPIQAMNGHLRSSAPGGNSSTILTEYGIYDEYLDRLHQRYTEPASVPYRGFAMGGTADFDIPLQQELSLQGLNLPMYVEFNSNYRTNTGEGNPFNWISQLQAGPKGNTNYGAYNGNIFPNERNARNCQYTQLKDARTFAPYNSRNYSNLDNNGMEWAGLFAHSGPYDNSFNANYDGATYDGVFISGTFGPFWGNSLRRTGGYIPLPGRPQNPSGYYYYYNDNNLPSDPFNMVSWRNKYAFFRYIVPSNNISPATYSIYLNYPDLPANCTNCLVNLVEAQVTTGTYPNQPNKQQLQMIDYSLGIDDPKCLNMQKHIHRDGTSNWELVFSNISLTKGHMVILQIAANGQDGDVIADAVRFKCANPAVDDRLDNVEPTTNPGGAGGNAIFSTPGFFTDDWVDRSFISMQDEDNTNHRAYSKTPFYLASACYNNDFIYINSLCSIDNTGNLEALGHNGLICLGTSSDGNPDAYNDPYINTLASGKDFGQALVAQAQAHTSFYGYSLFCLLGAGTLRAQPYVQYGTEKEENKTVSTTVTKSSTNPVLIRGVTVSSSGNYTVTSTVTTSPPQQCSHSEVVIRGETVFTQGCTADIKAN